MKPRPSRINTKPGKAVNKFLLDHEISTGLMTRSDDNFLYFEPSFDAREEWLADEERGLGKMNDCSHYKCERFVNPMLDITYTGTYANPIAYDWYERHSGAHSSAFWPVTELGTLDKPWTSQSKKLISLYYERDGHKYVRRPSNTDSLVSRSLSAMWPEVRARLSIINSILELRDVVSLKRAVEGIAKLDLVLRQLRKSKKKGWKRASLRRILRSGAEGYLSYQFGIAPLLSDIENLAKALKNYRREVQNLLDRERTVQKRHFESVLGTDEFVDVAATAAVKPQSNADGVFTQSRATTYDVRKFNATMEFTYELSEYERRNALVGGLLDSIGVSLNPAIIWNAIPWSFTVDWVAQVGGLIDSFKLRQLEPRVIIHNYCWSVSVRRQTVSQMAIGIGGGRIADQTVFPMTISESAYLRENGIPSWSLHHSLATSGLNRKEISLSAALAFAR